MIQINENFHAARQEIMDKYVNFNTLKDSRITIFTNCIVALDGVYICFLIRSYDIWEDDWWKKKERLIGEIRRPPQEDMPTFVYGFDSFTLTAYFNLLFIALENGLRSFYKPVFPTKNVPDNFYDVYKNILSDLQLTRYLNLMDILRLVRNAMMHQNGIHISKDDTVSWRGITITFTNGKPINYGREPWEVLPSISQGIVDMLKQVVNSPKIIQESAIIDPSYAYL
jgi:hypothetical protein